MDRVLVVGLPVGGDDEEGLWFDGVGDFVAEGLEGGVGWVVGVFDQIWSAGTMVSGR